ncbi:hypothetical protein LTR27_006996 [Elasticomyces elasticus]|nr:hypothetical protein LTR27_006996 [Elasticomyces elasticus]
MSSEAKSPTTPVYVWVVQHCEFDDEEDYEGHTTVLEVHADLASANQAAREHFDWAYEDTHEREEDDDEDEDEKEDYDDVKHHLNSNGCYERQHETNDGCHGGPRYTHPRGSYFTVSVEGHFLKGTFPVQQTKTPTNVEVSATTESIDEPETKKRKQQVKQENEAV